MKNNGLDQAKGQMFPITIKGTIKSTYSYESCDTKSLIGPSKESKLLVNQIKDNPNLQITKDHFYRMPTESSHFSKTDNTQNNVLN